MQIKANIAYFQDLTKHGEKLTDSRALLLLIIFAALSFIPTLFLPSVGEEGVYTNITLEMLYNQSYLTPTLYGIDYYRPPLFNWLILLVTKMLGTSQVVVAARLVNMAATLSTTALLVHFVKRVFANQRLALFTAAIYLSGDLLFKRGWLAYADSLFALWVFASIVCAWFALQDKQERWFIGAALSLAAGFLTKVHTIYIFYALACLVLMWQHPNRKFFWRPTSIVAHVLAALFPAAWAVYLRGGFSDLQATANYSQTLLQWPGLFSYVAHVILAYPLNLILRFLPASILAIWACFKVPSGLVTIRENRNIRIVFWLTILNLLPYWFAPTSTIRYILPLYPFIVLLVAYVIWHSTTKLQTLTVQLLVVACLFKYIIANTWLPYEHRTYRGNAATVAKAILHEVKDARLYINDSSSAGLRVAVELNKLRTQSPPLTSPEPDFEGYVLCADNDPSFGKVQQVYHLRNAKLYLLFKASPS